tara:strand:+ start:944 stop:1243 length:300 start_codon:yes stop_codon:yes gene_type:complete
MYTFTKYDDDGDVSVSVSNEHADIHEILERFQAFLYASGFTWVEEGSIIYEEPTIEDPTSISHSYTYNPDDWHYHPSESVSIDESQISFNFEGNESERI